MSTHPVLDRKKLAGLEDLGGADLIRKIIGLFLEYAPARIEVMLRGESERTLKEVAFAAHALKSSAGNLGLRELQFLCDDLEAAAAGGDESECRGLVVRLLDSYERSCAALVDERGKAAE